MLHQERSGGVVAPSTERYMFAAKPKDREPGFQKGQKMMLCRCCESNTGRHGPIEPQRGVLTTILQRPV